VWRHSALDTASIPTVAVQQLLTRVTSIQGRTEASLATPPQREIVLSLPLATCNCFRPTTASKVLVERLAFSYLLVLASTFLSALFPASNSACPKHAPSAAEKQTDCQKPKDEHQTVDTWSIQEVQEACLIAKTVYIRRPIPSLIERAIRL
jgi:hypothetical protein